MRRKELVPDYVFEASWEVCNKVGGIYTVLSTRAKILQDSLKDNIIFIGPDCWGERECPYFSEDEKLLSGWRKAAKSEGLDFRVGRWSIPGEPVTVLVDFHPFFDRKNIIYTKLWEDYRVDSLHAYGDYDEASMFAYAAARAAESYYHYFINSDDVNVVYHANEWMTGLGALYINKFLPQAGTVFTTHATSIGRSICGNNKPLYGFLHAYNGDQMAMELNMQSKHSVEKQTARYVDCFTTVSDITAKECKVLLEKECDMVLPNGFEDNFVPKGDVYKGKRAAARKALLRIANCLTGKEFSDDTLIVSTSGRYEVRNKGIDLFISAMNSLRYDDNLTREILAVIEVPGWVSEPRKDLQERMNSGETFHEPLQYPQLTHWLHNRDEDCVVNMCMQLGIRNGKADKVTVVFIPCYLTGSDGVLNMEYYDVMPANDLCVFPSYYEPWGYTPLESIAFKVPCITTDLAGFGLWVNNILGRNGEITDGVKVIHRMDCNFDEVAEQIKNTVAEYANFTEPVVRSVRNSAGRLSKKALWEKFIVYYYKAYDTALRRAKARMKREERELVNS